MCVCAGGVHWPGTHRFTTELNNTGNKSTEEAIASFSRRVYAHKPAYHYSLSWRVRVVLRHGCAFVQDISIIILFAPTKVCQLSPLGEKHKG